MTRFAAFIGLLLLLNASSSYAQAIITGHITVDGGEPVAFANVGLRGTTLGQAANAEGAYRIEGVPAGTYVLAASAVGYTTGEKTITLADGGVLTVDFVLQERVIESEGIVVTGTLKETFVEDSPVKVEVISARYLEKVPSANIMDVIENVNGLYQQIDCGVCYTNNIRINGMDGPYTAVLIDGMPVMSALATVYGLNGISPSLIQQIEVIKGPVSTLYGTEALGGVINIITKRPQNAPRLSLNTFATSHREMDLDFALTPSRGRFASLVSGHVFHNDHFIDENGDRFSDLTLDTRVSLFGKGTLNNRDGFKRFDVSGKYYFEDRLNGVDEFVRRFSDDLRGSGEVYGETIRTHRVELLGTAYLHPSRRLRLDLAYNWHDQDSFYGAQGYTARQQVYFSQLVWTRRLGQQHDLLVGSTLRYQRYDDNTGSTGAYDEAGRLLANAPDNRFIPGVFVQHEYLPSRQVRLLGGLRLDHQAEHGFIISPRASLKVQPSDYTTLRMNFGTGFRVVNLFTEDHAAYTGARATVILEDLKPERSYSGTVSLQHVLGVGNPLTIDLDAFYTYFTNKIEPDYSNPGEIRYANLDGSAATRGLAANVTQSFTAIPLSYTIGATVMDVFTLENGQRRWLEFTPRFQGIVNASYHLHGPELTFDYTANLTGPMRLPEYAPPYERDTRSPVFSVHNLQVTKEFDLTPDTGLDVYLGLRNLTDYTQAESPLIAYNEGPAPGFGEHFDTNYVYGPIRGRNVALGLRLTLR